MMKYCILLFLLTIIFCKLISAQPVIVFENPIKNMDTIIAGDDCNWEYKFKNTGNEPLVISGARGSGSIIPTWSKELIPSGQSGIIKALFNTAGRRYAFDKTCTINSNAAENPVVLHLKGYVLSPEVELSPEGINMEVADRSDTTVAF